MKFLLFLKTFSQKGLSFSAKLLINHKNCAKITLSQIIFAPKNPLGDGTETQLSVNLNEVSTEALAYLGDCVIELKVREALVDSGIAGSGNLNRASLLYVKASAQAAAMRKIIPQLTEEETAIFKRGRNMSGGNVPKSATMSEYRTATGMEVLFGYLHLSGQRERIDTLFAAAYSTGSNNQEEN